MSTKYIHLPKLLANLTRFKDFREDFGKFGSLETFDDFWLVGYYEHERLIDSDDTVNSEQKLSVRQLIDYAIPKLVDITYAYKASAAPTRDELLATQGTWSDLYPDASPDRPYIWVRSTYTYSNDEEQVYYHITDKYAGRDSSTIDISGTKTWIGFSETPENPTLILTRTALGVPVETVAATPVWDGNTYTYENLERYTEDQYPYTYIVDEVESSDYTGYKTQTESGYDFVNVSNATISVTVNKHWVTSGEPAPEITCLFKVMADNTEKANVIVNAGNEWTATVYDLPKYNEKGEIVYTVVEETTLENWDVSYARSIDADGNIIIDVTNTHNGGLTKTIYVTKVWSDGVAGHEPVEASVTINGESETITLGANGANSWTWSKSSVPTNATIVVEELTEVEGYTSVVYNDSANTTFTIYNQENTGFITVEKVWSDDNPPVSSVSAFITINGDTSDIEVTDQGWVSSRKYPYDSTTVSVVEKPIEGYTSTVTNLGFDFTITNTPVSPDPPEPPTPTYDTLTVTKVWSPAGSAPSNSIDISVSIDRVQTTETITAVNNWAYTNTEVPSGATVVVDEPNVPSGFTKTVTHNGLDWTVTNTQNVTPVNFEVWYTENFNDRGTYPFKQASTTFPQDTPKQSPVTHYLLFNPLLPAWTSVIRVSKGHTITNNNLWCWAEGQWTVDRGNHLTYNVSMSTYDPLWDFYTFSIDAVATDKRFAVEVY